MALLACVECGRQVSDQAPACPGCGLPAAPKAIIGLVPVEPAPFSATRTHVGAWLGGQAARHPAAAVFGVLSTLAALFISYAIATSAHAKAEQEKDRRAVEDRAAETRNEHVREEEARQAEVAAASARLAKSAKTTEQSGAMNRSARDAWIRKCFAVENCAQWMVDAMIDGAPEGNERVHAKRASFAASVEKIAREGGKDGSQVAGHAVAAIAVTTAREGGLAMLDIVPRAQLADAKKDPESSRGKLVKAGGSIVEIHQKDGITEGALMTDGATVVHFFTSMATTGIYDGAWASFVGVFVQEYDYANVSGGQTRSYLLVGAFDLPQNH